jgi:acylglycerol lipase
MEHIEGHFEGPRSLRLYYQGWLPEGQVRAVLLVVHGLGEHCGRYANLVRHFSPLGYAIYSFDLPGHGRSEGPREYVDSFSEFTSAVSQYYQMVKNWCSDQPLFLVGHSLGGLIVTRYLIDNQHQFQGAVISAPAVKIPPSITQTTLRLAKILALLTPRLGLQSLDASGISRDARVVQAYIDDPLVFHDKTPARMAYEGLKAIQYVMAHIPQITLPFITLQGSGDTLVDVNGAQYLYDQASSQDKTIKIYEGLYHEVFNEPENSRVFKDVEDWLEARL